MSIRFCDLPEGMDFVFIGSPRGPFRKTGERSYTNGTVGYECGTPTAWVALIPASEAGDWPAARPADATPSTAAPGTADPAPAGPALR
jgi:hypothetical protein